MVSRDTLLRYGALLLILVFVGETIFLGLSYTNSGDSTASPTPAPLSFSGTVQSPARVLQLGFSGLAMCNSATGLDKELKNSSGVRTALFASPEILAVQFEQNASLDFAESRVAQVCGSPLFRIAGVDLIPAQLELNTSSGIQPISTRQLDAYFLSQGLPGFQAFVSPALSIGDRLNVTISIVVQDGSFVSVAAQQPEFDVLALMKYPNSLFSVLPVANDSEPSLEREANDSLIGLGGESLLDENSSFSENVTLVENSSQ